MNKFRIFFALSLFLISLSFTFSVGAEEDDSVRSVSTSSLSDQSFSNGIHVVTGRSFPPYIDMEKENGGIVTDIVMSVLKKAFPTESVELHVEPWKRGYYMALETQYWGVFPLAKTEEREALFHFSEPLLSLTDVFFVRANSLLNYRKLEDLSGTRVCRPIGFNINMLEPWLEKDYITLTRPETLASCFRMLSADRVDLVVVNKKIGDQVIEKHKELQVSDFRVLPKSISTLELHFLVSKKEPNAEQFLDRFNQYLAVHLKKYQYYFDVSDAPDKSILEKF